MGPKPQDLHGNVRFSSARWTLYEGASPAERGLDSGTLRFVELTNLLQHALGVLNILLVGSPAIPSPNTVPNRPRLGRCFCELYGALRVRLPTLPRVLVEFAPFGARLLGVVAQLPRGLATPRRYAGAGAPSAARLLALLHLRGPLVNVADPRGDEKFCKRRPLPRLVGARNLHERRHLPLIRRRVHALVNAPSTTVLLCVLWHRTLQLHDNPVTWPDLDNVGLAHGRTSGIAARDCHSVAAEDSQSARLAVRPVAPQAKGHHFGSSVVPTGQYCATAARFPATEDGEH
mmetsp:Transcript_14149/g.38852  ORF Transcript_14149/g.38852 Transcript_14149/m.38852 type:complete len:289 (+) Transcript_14149:1764-2630(+)